MDRVLVRRRMERIVVRVTATIENGKDRCENEHRRNCQNQNAVAKSSLAARAGCRCVVVTESATLGKDWMRTKQRNSESQRGR